MSPQQILSEFLRARGAGDAEVETALAQLEQTGSYKSPELNLQLIPPDKNLAEPGEVVSSKPEEDKEP